MIKKLVKKIRKNPNLFYFLYKLYLPIKNFRKRDLYNKYYEMESQELLKTKGKKALFVGIPIHNNLGDQAQYYCIKKWLKENYPDYSVVEFTDNIIYTNHKNIINLIKENITNEDFFVFQSGYRTTDVSNFEGEYAHQKILSNFSNKVIVFPQTVNFKSKKEQQKSSNAYKKNSNYVFLARDEISYKTATEIYDKNRVLLYPDIVTSLIGNCDELIEQKHEKEGILFCLRNDDEKLYSNEEYNAIIGRLKELTDTIDVTDTNSSKSFKFDKSEVESEIANKLNQFAKYKLIITDRYHGTIFSLVSNTNVIVLNSTDHKLSSGVNWFKGIYDNKVVYCNKLNELCDTAVSIYNNADNQKLNSYFNEKYYSELKSKVDEIIK